MTETKIDRLLQKNLLVLLGRFYPNPIDQETFSEISRLAQTPHKLAQNLFYLQEYNLVNSGLLPTSDGSFLFDYKEIRITAQGIDLLLDDGGLESIIKILPTTESSKKQSEDNQ